MTRSPCRRRQTVVEHAVEEREEADQRIEPIGGTQALRHEPHRIKNRREVEQHHGAYGDRMLEIRVDQREHGQRKDKSEGHDELDQDQ